MRYCQNNVIDIGVIRGKNNKKIKGKQLGPSNCILFSRKDGNYGDVIAEVGCILKMMLSRVMMLHLGLS